MGVPKGFTPMSVSVTQLANLQARTAYLTLPEVAELLGFHLQVVHRWVRSGRIPATRIMGRIRFYGPDLAEWIKAQN